MSLLDKVEKYAINIVRSLQEAGYEAYIVGGAVRDLYLDRIPKDYDISTSATPEEIRKIFGRRKARIIGKRFRLVHLHTRHEVVEISTFRRTPKNHQKRIPSKLKNVPDKMIFRDNEYGTVEEDAERRDFTVNALYYDPIKDEVKDFSGYGLEDLKNKKVRVIGDPESRFEEDPVRLLRALKLVGQYGFTMTKDTEDALTSSLQLFTLGAPARLTLELEKILLNPYCSEILEAVHKHGLMKYYLPYLAKRWDSPAGDYMRQLLKMKNERMLRGCYRNSISLSIAAMVLPFVESEVGFSDNGALWDYYPGIVHKVRKTMTNVLNPLSFCKLITSSAVRMLLMQSELIDAENGTELLNERSYPHARELLMIQNEVMWHDNELEDLWPARVASRKQDHRPRNKNNGNRRRRRAPRRNSKKNN